VGEEQLEAVNNIDLLYLNMKKKSKFCVVGIRRTETGERGNRRRGANDGFFKQEIGQIL